MSDSPTEAFEHAEHAEHAAHSGEPFLAKVSVTIAILAVMAATLGSLETLESGEAISAKNESVLVQNQAADHWAFFQAQSIKRNMYEIAAGAVTAKAEAYEAKARDYEKESATTRADAERLERERDGKLDDSMRHEKRHHVLTTGVTMIHVGIAIATVSIIMRGQRWPWHASMVLGVLGLLVSASAYLR